MRVQVNRRQAQSEAVEAEYRALQQHEARLQDQLLEANSQVVMLQAQVGATQSG